MTRSDTQGGVLTLTDPWRGESYNAWNWLRYYINACDAYLAGTRTVTTIIICLSPSCFSDTAHAYVVVVHVSSNHRLTKYTAFKLQFETIHKWDSPHLYNAHLINWAYSLLARSHATQPCTVLFTFFCKHKAIKYSVVNTRAATFDYFRNRFCNRLMDDNNRLQI